MGCEYFYDNDSKSLELAETVGKLTSNQLKVFFEHFMSNIDDERKKLVLNTIKEQLEENDVEGGRAEPSFSTLRIPVFDRSIAMERTTHFNVDDISMEETDSEMQTQGFSLDFQFPIDSTSHGHFSEMVHTIASTILRMTTQQPSATNQRLASSRQGRLRRTQGLLDRNGNQGSR
jgi:hypothetical protein